MPPRQDDARPASPWHLRAAALLTLGAVVVFLPLQALYDPAQVLATLWPAYLLQGGLAGLLLAASFTEAGARHAEELSIVFILGLGVDLLWSFSAAPSYPALTAFALVCLLMGSTVFFAWPVRWVFFLALAGWTGFALAGTRGHLTRPPDAPLVLALTALAVGATIAVASAQVLARFRASLARRQRELATLSARLMSVQEEERRRLSRELHDELGQSLTAVSAYLWLIEQKLPGELDELRRHTAEARRLAAQTLAHMRELSQLLRPSVLDDLGLVPSLDSHLQAFGGRHEIATRFTADELPERLPTEVETAVFRIAQEALTNVARHARASRVQLSLVTDGEELRLEVQDDGIGFPDGNGAAQVAGTGLIGIRERVLALGGTMTVRSEHGTRLTVRLPLPH